MSQPQYSASVENQVAPTVRPQGAPPASWTTGLASFAGVMMIIAGIFGAIEGIVALFRNEVFVVGAEYAFAFDLTAWGWIHLLVGILVAAAGAAVRAGRAWGRAVGITLAALSMFANFLFIPYYPMWSLLIIVLNVFVIAALCLYRDPADA
ncbi:DUF7144 family membrane protein [Pseudonocardia parietis]|uniref:Vacuolar-type H+-ATPase subunit I/STV1 n=1 Tax=Pseudonocardia parietis TaxID=570936 RepID=A0ABS4VL10_9PSEU|nr:hypothetical protein [Pseudonocardia parietis]MBP2364585.1 vacuolar-type H+-ATPase subunit I/STV1 [Pseudonocardia parietis]